MKPLTKATQRKFTPLLERLPSYMHDRFKNDRLSLTTTYNQEGQPNTIAEVFSVRPNDPNKYRCETRYSYAFMDDLFEKRYLREGRYNVPLTDSNVEQIFHCWPNNQLMLDNLSREICARTLAEGIRQDMNARLIKNYKENKVVPPGDYPSGEFVPTCYQKLVRSLGSKSNYLALFMEQGTGKTGAALGVIIDDYLRLKRQSTEHKFYRVLIICPKAVRYNWTREISLWVPEEIRYRTEIIRGNKIEREISLIRGLAKDDKTDISFVIASYGALRTTENAFCLKEVLAGQVPLGEDLKWDLALLDESHYIKSPKAKRTKSAHNLREAANKRLILTGTPIANSLLDFWAQLEFLNRGLSGFSNVNAFRDFHSTFDREMQRNGGAKDLEMTNIPLFKERIARTAYVTKKKEALPDLPDKVYDNIEVAMTPEQAKIYSKVLQGILTELDVEMAESDLPREMMINNVLTKLLRLAQVTSGFVTWDAQYDDEGNLLQPQIIDRIDPNPKLESLVDICKERGQYEKTIIWACFRQDIATISARLGLENIDHVVYHGGVKEKDRETSVERFNTDPSCRFFVGNPSAGGIGLNLLGYDFRNESKNEDSRLTNCNRLIYYSQNWNYPVRAQSEDRAHRKGTRTHVQITNLVVPGSIDEEIRNRVEAKKEAAMSIVDLKKTLLNLGKPLVASKEDVD